MKCQDDFAVTGNNEEDDASEDYAKAEMNPLQAKRTARFTESIFSLGVIHGVIPKTRAPPSSQWHLFPQKGGSWSYFISQFSCGGQKYGLNADSVNLNLLLQCNPTDHVVTYPCDDATQPNLNCRI